MYTKVAYTKDTFEWKLTLDKPLPSLGENKETLYRWNVSSLCYMASRYSNNEPRDVLALLRQTLVRLDRTGDSASPSIVDLRRIIVERIAELETAVRRA
jgi:hypothetical protein